MAEGNSNSSFTKPFKWLLISLGIKLALYFIFILPDTNPNRKFNGPFLRSADHAEYLRPVDNLIERGIYAMDGYNDPYAGRLPGFVFPYILFRALLNENAALCCLGVFILTLAIIASYTLGLLLFNLTQKRWTFVLGFLLMNLAPYHWHYDWTLHTSSLGVSSLVFFCYYFHSYLQNTKAKYLLLAGFFLAWLIFLRGFCLVYLPVTLLFVVYIERQRSAGFKSLITSLIVFSSSFIIMESIWVARNFISMHQFIPLQTSFVPVGNSKNPEHSAGSNSKYSVMKIRELVFAWGGENAWYFKNSDMGWFLNSPKTDSAFQFDKSIFFEGFTLDSLKQLRNNLILSSTLFGDTKKQDSVEQATANLAIRLKERFVANKKLYSYLYAPIKRTKNLFVQNVTQDWPGVNSGVLAFIQKVLKGLSLLCYLVLLLQIFIFPIITRKNKAPAIYWLFYLLSILNALVFIMLVPMSHYTYFIFGFTLLIPIFVYNLKAFLKQ